MNFLDKPVQFTDSDFPIEATLPSVDTSSAPPRKIFRHLEKHDYILELDNSARERLTSCPRSAEFYLINRRQEPPKAALAFGSAIHKALENIYLNNYKSLKHLHIAPTFVEKTWAASAGIKAVLEQKPIPLDDYRTPDFAMQVIEKYLKTYENENISVVEVPGPGPDNSTVPAIEQGFFIPLSTFEVGRLIPYNKSLLVQDCDSDEPFFIENLHVAWTGMIDLIFSQGEDIWIMDHKTTSIGGPTFFDAFTISQQTVGYTWAAEQILQRPVKGLALNALFCRKPTPTGKSIELSRQKFIYTDEQKSEWLEDTIMHVEQFLLFLTHGLFPKATNHCQNKYGACPYTDVCNSASKFRSTILGSSRYSNVTWNPLD